MIPVNEPRSRCSEEHLEKILALVISEFQVVALGAISDTEETQRRTDGWAGFLMEEENMFFVIMRLANSPVFLFHSVFYQTYT